MPCIWLIYKALFIQSGTPEGLIGTRCATHMSVHDPIVAYNEKGLPNGGPHKSVIPGRSNLNQIMIDLLNFNALRAMQK